mmetsp:Transcript_42713/g.166884  ORF Transcript_42713/g.166884 Transcript_42713/m.166884 type:complete len:128 (-) Transcript_42713:8258-8641(-)
MAPLASGSVLSTNPGLLGTHAVRLQLRKTGNGTALLSMRRPTILPEMKGFLVGLHGDERNALWLRTGEDKVANFIVVENISCERLFDKPFAPQSSLKYPNSDLRLNDGVLCLVEKLSTPESMRGIER